jgi:NTE family protein
MLKVLSYILLILLWIPLSAVAQSGPPRIGLVLSGGGAKGLAHIGVLKVLEAEGIVPDYITGTSMGGIIGGLYAVGYSSHELDSIVTHVNWNRLLTDDIPLSSVSPHEKNDYSRYQVEFTITRDGLVIPSGLIKGQQISELLSGLTWHVADINNFDELPIPFRCVAADLRSGSPFVFKEGDLTTAMRASMSIPSAFSPVRTDTLLLVDGGILNNFPVTLCKEMGADIIIGVNVSSIDKTGQENLKNLADILMDVSTIAGNTAMKRAIKNTDFLISPDLKNYNMSSFSDAAKIIRIGEEAAREKIDILHALMDSAGIQPMQMPMIDKSRNQKMVASKIRINGLKNIDRQFVTGNLAIQPGDTITPESISQGLKKTMGTRHFENITYRFEPLDLGYLLDLTVEESPQAKAKFSLHYDNEYKAGLLANLTLRNFFGKSSRTSFTTDICETPTLNISQINFLGDKQITAAKLDMNYENNNLPVYLDNGSRYGTFKHQYTTLQGGFMTAIGTNWQLDAYAQYTRSTLQNKSGFSEIFYAGVERFGNAFLSSDFDFIYSSIDSRYFPKRGTHVKLNYHLNLDIQELYRGSEEGKEMVSPLTSFEAKNYFTVEGHYRRYFSINSRLTTELRLSGQFTSRPLPFLDLTFIGGLPFNNRSNEIHFIGYSFREKLVEDFALGEIDFRYRILKQVHLTAIGGLLLSTTNLPEVIEPIGLDKTERVWGYGLMVAYDSFLGPLQAGLGSNDSDNRLRWFFNFGFNF